jgi:hypothetical protein
MMHEFEENMITTQMKLHEIEDADKLVHEISARGDLSNNQIRTTNRACRRDVQCAGCFSSLSQSP